MNVMERGRGFPIGEPNLMLIKLRKSWDKLQSERVESQVLTTIVKLN